MKSKELLHDILIFTDALVSKSTGVNLTYRLEPDWYIGWSILAEQSYICIFIYTINVGRYYPLF